LFAVALGSGIFIGMHLHQPHPGERPPQDRSWLADKLDLAPEQREQMRNIWSELAHGPGGRHGDARRQAGKERDDAIATLITPEQKPAYDKIFERFNQQMADMSREREATFQKAVERTKAILNAEQRSKYEKMLAEGPGAGGPEREHAGRGPASRAATQPIGREH
jgi:Spy/CpxP family protein refolding chaperone